MATQLILWFRDDQWLQDREGTRLLEKQLQADGRRWKVVSTSRVLRRALVEVEGELTEPTVQLINKAMSHAVQARLNRPMVSIVAHPERKMRSSGDFNTCPPPGPGLHASPVRNDGITVAVMDTHFVSPLPDFDGRVSWFNVINGRLTKEEGSVEGEAHATHVAGVIAGARTGLAPAAKIWSIKATDAWQAARALEDLAASYNDRVRVVCMTAEAVDTSRSSSDTEPDELHDAIRLAYSRNIVVCAAAGNGTSAAVRIKSPGTAPSAITVGAYDDLDHRAKGGESVHVLSCSGTDKNQKPTLLAYWGPHQTAGTGAGRERSYACDQGTSMATAYVSGVAARCLQKDPAQTSEQIQGILLASCRLLGDMAHPVPPHRQGRGMLEGNEAIAAVPDESPAALDVTPTSPPQLHPR